ncbi:MAG: ATP-binding protein [Muribaculaceae bacterium]
MRFKDIPGHEDVKARLREMADSHRLPHALLLEGPVGSAKFMLIRAFAQYIHCENHTPGGDSCGKCPSCLQHQTFNHIDTIYSFPVIKKAGKSTISNDCFGDFKTFITDSPYMDIEKWIGLLGNINSQPVIYVEEGAELIRRLNFTARQSQFKIVLLWLPERLKEETANKLLKLIEEPHPDTIFLMSSDNSRAILPTIYSRVQRIAVCRYSDDEIKHFLTASYPVSETDAETLARLSSGNVIEALSLVDISRVRQQFLDFFIELMRKAYQRKVGLLRQWSNDVAALGREQIIKFLDYASRLIRENFILNLHVDQLNYLTEDERKFSVNFARFINERNVLKMFEVLNKAREDVAGNANPKIVLFDLAVKTILLIKQ